MKIFDIPKELQEIIEILEHREREFEILWNPNVLRSGKKIIERLFGDIELQGIEPSLSGSYINVIPPVGHPGPCRSVLLVAIGSLDSIENRILEAVEHIYVKCAGITKYVIFYAAKWNQEIWIRHEQSFRPGITVVLKIPSVPAVRLV